MKDTSYVKGSIRATVLGPDGLPKRRRSVSHRLLFSVIGRLFRGGIHLDEVFDVLRYQVAVNHNVVTDEGDALIADLMSETPARVKVDNTNGHIQVGTGWTGVTPKTNIVVNTPSGLPGSMEATYPKQKGAFGAADDNVVQYRVVFSAGDLNENGIDEAALLNHVTPASADCMAYAEISPSVNVTTADTLQIDWELTFLGA